MRKKLLLIGILLIIALAGCSSDLNIPTIELSTSSFNLGDIGPDEGIRTENFFVKNTGNIPLKIISVSTSCGCTEAEVEDEEILPGEQSTLTVNYDPSVHPGLVGRIKRIVYIKSNDPRQPEVELELVGNSLPSENSHEGEEVGGHDEEHEGSMENYEISPVALDRKIRAGESFKLVDVREDFEFEENHIKDTLLLSVNEISQAELDKLGLKKDDEIILYCRSGRRSATAYEVLTSLGYTNVKSLHGGIVHWMEDGYAVEQGEQVAQIKAANEEVAPKIQFNRTEHDFGFIKQYGGIVNTEFQVMNSGKSDLHITSISTSCACASAELEDLVILPGYSSTLSVFLDPNFHEEPAGRFSRTIFLETNDPLNPEADVKIWMDIVEGE